MRKTTVVLIGWLVLMNPVSETDAAEKVRTEKNNLKPAFTSVLAESNSDNVKYRSWIKDDLFPMTREYTERVTYGRCYSYYPLRTPPPYSPIKLFAEVPVSKRQDFSAKSLLAPTQMLFGKDGENNFRSALATEGWDDQENQKLTPVDEESECIDFAFPQSRELLRKVRDPQWVFTSGGITYAR